MTALFPLMKICVRDTGLPHAPLEQIPRDSCRRKAQFPDRAADHLSVGAALHSFLLHIIDMTGGTCYYDTYFSGFYSGAAGAGRSCVNCEPILSPFGTELLCT